MNIKLLNVGFGNVVLANRIIAIVSPDSAPMKRLKEDARERGMLIDATHGRRTRAIIITDSNHVVLSAVQPETSAGRLLDKEVKFEKEEAFEEAAEDDSDGAAQEEDDE
ncbi:MAG TPA: DUF370 domain-containing protein [Candidatus Wallbacteria bacterium]|nr:MAG: hypothetical protein BWY32_00757 [bacterium ADurb.Bin243]HOT74212.1 DUF370 domain-containing protein [Candidatus Wallbacteria bacterium]